MRSVCDAVLLSVLLTSNNFVNYSVFVVDFEQVFAGKIIFYRRPNTEAYTAGPL